MHWNQTTDEPDFWLIWKSDTCWNWTSDLLTACDALPTELKCLSNSETVSDCQGCNPVGSNSPINNVHISVPNGTKGSSGDNFTISGLYHHLLSMVLKSALSDTMSLCFHFSPFKRFWQSPSGLEQQCYDEAYTSDAWLKYHNELQLQPNEPGCKLEKVVLGLMFSSNSTHLMSFGMAKVWPLYMYIGNLSKHFHNKLRLGACHHVVYIPLVSLFGIFLSINWLFWY